MFYTDSLNIALVLSIAFLYILYHSYIRNVIVPNEHIFLSYYRDTLHGKFALKVYMWVLDETNCERRLYEIT